MKLVLEVAAWIPVPGPAGPAGPPLAPTTEGPELPVSTPMMPFNIPAAAPANSNSGGGGGTTSLRTLNIGVFIAIIIFY
ncbi:uncharacterized protein A4U43_C05F590 [Asparagus officinalis]|uniref:Uncharacterized protein n=1 Tax=Asparagus officinalis TaxID=4686 RepID=A0A5P1ETU9_ASPOF|nr:uncharacterized protein A4U43_C05F590 [Asparagus officinalis]